MQNKARGGRVAWRLARNVFNKALEVSVVALHCVRLNKHGHFCDNIDMIAVSGELVSVPGATAAVSGTAVGVSCKAARVVGTTAGVSHTTVTVSCKTVTVSFKTVTVSFKTLAVSCETMSAAGMLMTVSCRAERDARGMDGGSGAAVGDGVI